MQELEYFLKYTFSILGPFLAYTWWIWLILGRYIYGRTVLVLKKNDLILYGNSNEYIYYVARRKGNKIIQRWVFDRKSARKEKDQFEHKRYFIKIRNERNRNGVREHEGKFKFGGKHIYRLKEPFTPSDYNRYDHLMRKKRFIWKGSLLPAMKGEEWDRARLTSALYTGIKNLTEEEKDELFRLIVKKRKLNEQKYPKKRLLAPYDVFFIKAVMYERGGSDEKPDYVFEDDLEKLKQSIDTLEPNKERVLGNKGIYVGGGMYYPDQGNFLTVGGTRSGKGTNLIIPQLLSTDQFQGSTVIIDVKGENAAITAKHLKDAGKEVYILDPWNLQAQIGADHGIAPSTYNPLDILKDGGDDVPDECDMFAEMLIPHNPRAKDQHFDSRARQLISAYLLNMTSHESYADHITLAKLRSLLRLPETGDTGQQTRPDFLIEMQFNDAFDGILQDSANELKDMWLKGDREMQSIMSTALNATDIFKSQAMRKSLNSSDFDMKDLPKGNMVIFLCIPADRLQTHNVWLRLMVSAVIKSVQRHHDKRVLLLLDEFYSLGYMKLIDQSMSFMPGFNLHIWTIVQNISQLQENYNRNWETFISNSAASTWLGTNDNTTSEYLSRLMGTRHVKYMPTQSLLTEFQSEKKQTPQNYELPVQSPLEIRENPSIYALVKGLKPLNFEKEPYFINEVFKDRASRNPYFKEVD